MVTVTAKAATLALLRVSCYRYYISLVILDMFPGCCNTGFTNRGFKFSLVLSSFVLFYCYKRNPIEYKKRITFMSFSVLCAFHVCVYTVSPMFRAIIFFFLNVSFYSLQVYRPLACYNAFCYTAGLSCFSCL
jgi:hypothetical protein